MVDKFILIRNAEGDPLFMELSAGILYWILPNDISFSSILYFTHVTEDFKLYYENLQTKEVHWEEGNIDMSEEAKIVLSTVQQMSREEVEEILGTLFDADKIDEQIVAIDNYFLANEQQSTAVERKFSSIVKPPEPPSSNEVSTENIEKLNRSSVSYMQQLFNQSTESIVEPEPVIEMPKEEPTKASAININSTRPISKKIKPPSFKVNPPSRRSSKQDMNKISSELTSNNVNQSNSRPQPPAPIINTSSNPVTRSTSIARASILSNRPLPQAPLPPISIPPSQEIKSSSISGVSTNIPELLPNNRPLPQTPPLVIESSSISDHLPIVQEQVVKLEGSKSELDEEIVSITPKNTNLSNRPLPQAPTQVISIPPPPAIKPPSIPDIVSTKQDLPIDSPDATLKISTESATGKISIPDSENSESTVSGLKKQANNNSNIRKSIFDINKKSKAGYLNKLAKKSGINWKPRYFVLGAYNLSYFESEKPNEKLKGEVTITPETTVYSDKYDPKRGYLFKLSNQWETLVLAAASEIDRSEWLKELGNVIKYAKDYLMCYCALLHPSTTYVPPKKYFILANGILTFHSNALTTSKIEGKIVISDKTIIDKMDDFNQLITISDSSAFLNRITFQFKQVDPVFKINPTELYQQWKKELLKLVNPSINATLNSRKSIRFSQSSIIISEEIDSNASKPMNALQVNSIRKNSIKRNSISNVNKIENMMEPPPPSYRVPPIPSRPLVTSTTKDNDVVEELKINSINNIEKIDENTKSIKNINLVTSLSIDVPIRSGKLMKLSRQFGLKWSERKFVLKPFNITYYDSEVENGIMKGELQITSQCSVIADFKSDKKVGYLFKFTNQFESMTLAVSTEIERDGWVKDISAAIQYTSKCLFSYMILRRPLFKDHTDKYFLILGTDCISVHQSEQRTSEFKGVFKFSNETIIEEMDDYNKLITLSDPKSNIPSLSFSCTYVDSKSKYNTAQLYGIWKSAINRIIKSDNNDSGNSNTLSKRRNSRKSISLESNNHTDKTIPWCTSTNLNSSNKMNALETTAMRRASLKRNSIRNSISIKKDEEFDESLLVRPSYLALPPPPRPPSNPSLDNISSDNNIYHDMKDINHEEDISSNQQVNISLTDTFNNFTIDTYYDEQTSKTNQVMKGEQTLASRNALKTQLAKLKEMKQKQDLSPNSFKPPQPPPPPPLSQQKPKVDVNPILKNFQSPKNPLARSKN